MCQNQPPKEDGAERPKKEADNSRIKPGVYEEAESGGSERVDLGARKGLGLDIYSLQKHRGWEPRGTCSLSAVQSNTVNNFTAPLTHLQEHSFEGICPSSGVSWSSVRATCFLGWRQSHQTPKPLCLTLRDQGNTEAPGGEKEGNRQEGEEVAEGEERGEVRRQGRQAEGS